MKLVNAEKAMVDYMRFKVYREQSLSLVGECFPSHLKEELKEYRVKNIFSAKNPFSEEKVLGDILISTRACNSDTRYEDKYSLELKILDCCQKSGIKFIIIPCTCSLYTENEYIPYQQKISFFIRLYPCITKIDARNNWIILTNI